MDYAFLELFYLQELSGLGSHSGYITHDKSNSFTTEYFQVEAEILTFVLVHGLRLQVDFGRVQFGRAWSHSGGRERHRLRDGVTNSFQTPWTVLLVLLQHSPPHKTHLQSRAQPNSHTCARKDNRYHVEVKCRAKQGNYIRPRGSFSSRYVSDCTEVVLTGHRLLLEGLERGFGVTDVSICILLLWSDSCNRPNSISQRTPSVLVISHPDFQSITHSRNSKYLFWAETQSGKLEHGSLHVSVHVKQKHKRNRPRDALLRRAEEKPPRGLAVWHFLYVYTHKNLPFLTELFCHAA